MITLYSYPELFAVADNNPYGLKVFAFLKLGNLEFRHEHVFDAKSAPHAQLPYIVDDDVTVGDSDAIIAHVTAKYRVTMDSGLTDAQRTTHHAGSTYGRGARANGLVTIAADASSRAGESIDGARREMRARPVHKTSGK